MDKSEPTNYDVCNGCSAFFVSDLMFLLIELPFSKKIVDSLIILHRNQQNIRAESRKRTISRNWPSILYSQPLLLISSATRKTCPTARGIKPAVSSSYYILLTGSEINRHCIRTIPPSIVKDLFEHIRPSAPKKCNKAHLSASCLTIGKDADIIPINAALSKL